MILVSTTLTGNNESILQEALHSVVTVVDLCIVIDTGVTDKSLDRARDVCGDKLRIETYVWKNDFADARNFALDAAAKHGGTWALTLDTDERLHWGDLLLREVLSQTQADTLLVAQEDGNYAKERLVRVPTTLRWVGPTHEYLQRGSRVETLPTATFSELRKTPEQLERKFLRDAEVLERETQRIPQDPRWHFYLGDTYRNLGRLEDAARAYEACEALHGWDEEAGWACFRAAEIRFGLGQKEQALELCVQGLKHHPGIAELAWLAGFINYYLGRMHHAAHWSRMAVALGMYAGHFEQTQRIGFRWLPALWEKPFEVLTFALRALGDMKGAEDAETHRLRASRREKGFAL